MRKRSVEAVAADDLVEVWGGDGAGIYERVEAVDDELGTLEVEHRGGCEVVLSGDMVEEEGSDG